MRQRKGLKRLVSLLLSGILVAALSGCSTQQGAETWETEGSKTPLPSQESSQVQVTSDIPQQAPTPPTIEASPMRNLTESEEEKLSSELALFSADSASFVLGSAGTGENYIYSPVSLYVALSMLAECTDGDTRAEILDALRFAGQGADDLLAAQADVLYHRLNQTKDDSILRMSSSAWVTESLSPSDELRVLLEDRYHAPIQQVDFSSPQTSDQINQWASEASAGMLDDVPVKVSPELRALLINIAYFADVWTTPFQAARTAEQSFTRADGREVRCDFMNQTLDERRFIRTELFESASLSFEGGGAMHFILPAEGITPQAIAAQPEQLLHAVTYTGNDDVLRGEVVFSMPKLDLKSDLDLLPLAEQLGIQLAIEGPGDFAPLDPGNGHSLYVDYITQVGALKLDEEGVEAAVRTEIGMNETAAMVAERVVMKLDRPYLYVITSAEGYMLFVGIVNDPTI